MIKAALFTELQIQSEELQRLHRFTSAMLELYDSAELAEEDLLDGLSLLNRLVKKAQQQQRTIIKGVINHCMGEGA